MKEWLIWNLWERWAFRWKHRNDTSEEQQATLKEHWAAFLEANMDEPATKEFHDAVESMNAIFGATKGKRGDDL